MSKTSAIISVSFSTSIFKANLIIKDLNTKDKKELTNPGVLVQAKDTDGALLTYNNLVNSNNDGSG